MSDTSTPSNHDNHSRRDCSGPSGAKRESSAVALRPDSDTLRFIRSFALLHCGVGPPRTHFGFHSQLNGRLAIRRPAPDSGDGE